jgi:Carboxypeptidase regulatory-like domain
MFHLSFILAIMSAFGFFLSFPTMAKAQDVASMTGVVSDSSGAVVPAADVTLRNPQTGVVYKTTTNAAGSYTLTQIKPGPGYQLEVSRSGFKPVVISGLYLNVDATRVQNAELAVGGGTEMVEVSAETQTVTLDTTDATVGNNFQVQMLNDLPVQDRSNPSALFVDQPGVTLDGAVTGARTDQSRVTVDGLDVNDYATGEFGYIVARAPVDSVQEFRGVTAGDLSSAGGGGGGQYELVTKSGTNSFHGSLVEYHRDTDLEANDWFNNNAVPTVPRPPLIRNQFGGDIGGPIIKNKLFFFFDYNGRRDTLSKLVNRTVPLDSFRNSTLNYVNASNNIESLSSTQVAAFDPAGVGFNPALLSLLTSRYPHSNNLSAGDGGINTGGFQFNAPYPYAENDYVQRVDYNLSDKMKLWGKGSFVRTNGTESAIWFPGDPITYPNSDRSFTYAIGHVWTINNRMVNSAEYGEVYEDFNFPNTYNPTGVNQYQYAFANGTGGSIFDGPYGNAINAQGRTYPVPVIREDFSWDRGSHAFRFGGTFKWPRPSGYTILNYNSPTIGLGGYLSGLDPTLRPADICPSSSNQCGYAIGLYDAEFSAALAPFSQVGSTFNYDAQGNALPQGSGLTRTYRYYETELYFGDAWKVRPNLTVSYGVRWVNYSVPYEIHGTESLENFGFNQYFQDRVAQSAASQSGNLAVPLISYSLGGKANHAPGYFQPQYTNFGPRFAVAYSINPKTVINAGAGVIYDQTVINAVQYQESQYDYLFQAGQTNLFGSSTASPEQLLQTLTRFTGLANPAPPPAPPTITKPFYPYVTGSGSSAVPFGLANGNAFNETIDNHLKTPYSVQLDLGIQHEIPGGFILRASYAGRLGRRLLAQADANQLIDFADPVSGQLMSQAFAGVTQQLRAGADPLSLTEPWFENVLYPGFGAFYGFPNNTTFVSYGLNTYALRGDFADTMEFLSRYGGLPPNVGMGAQFSENTFYTNMGNSNYNGLLATLHKNVGHGLQFDLNYTWSHSIDNVSLVANTPAFGGYGFICDVLRPRECRDNSDFNVTQYFNGNFVYDLPFGRGRTLVASAPRWLDEAIGGWSVSGLPTWHTGIPYFMAANAFVAGYANDAPAILVGPPSDVKTHLTGGNGQPLYAFPAAIQGPAADYTGPVGFTIGPRNNLYGPHYFDLDLGLAKTFPLVADRVALKFRADAFNAFNHPNFQTPCTDITSVSCPYGQIQQTEPIGIDPQNTSASASRVLQLALRLEF